VTRIRSDQSGVTLIELMLVISLVGVVMGSTLTTFTQFEQTTATNQRQNQAQEQVRVGLAGLARELRNLASPTNERPEAIVRATGADLVFQSVSSTQTRRVRYCLDTANRRVWRQVQLSPFSLPSATSCPDAGWGSERLAIEDVVNGARPIFSYNVEDPLGITEITSTLWVDVDLGAKPAETSLQTSIFLRNQNRMPTASFTAVVSGSAIFLNGSESFDPEGRSLQFYWYDTSVPDSDACGPDPLPPQVPQIGCVGRGVVSTYAPTDGGTHEVYLVVSDPAGLTDEDDHETVCVTTAEDPCTP